MYLREMIVVVFVFNQAKVTWNWGHCIESPAAPIKKTEMILMCIDICTREHVLFITSEQMSRQNRAISPEFTLLA